MQFPIIINAPVSTRANKSALTLLPGGSQSCITQHYWFLLELGLARPDDNVFTSRAKYIDGFNDGLGSYDMTIGSLRSHVGEEAANLLLKRLDGIGLEQSLVNHLYELRHGYTPDPLVLQHLRDPPSYSTLLHFVLSDLTDRNTGNLPSWVYTVDAALAPLGLRHHMTVSDIVVDASTVGRTSAPPGLLPMRVRHPVWMEYGKPLDALELPAPILVDLKDNLGIRFVFELGFLSLKFAADRYTYDGVNTINQCCMQQNMWLRVGSLYQNDSPPPRISTYGFGLMNKGVVEKSGNCTLMALVMQTPEELGLTEDEAREGREFLAHQALDFGRHLHNVIREVDY